MPAFCRTTHSLRREWSWLPWSACLSPVGQCAMTPMTIVGRRRARFASWRHSIPSTRRGGASKWMRLTSGRRRRIRSSCRPGGSAVRVIMLYVQKVRSMSQAIARVAGMMGGQMSDGSARWCSFAVRARLPRDWKRPRWTAATSEIGSIIRLSR